MRDDVNMSYVIFFRGLNNLIDEDGARQLAKNRGCEALFYSYQDSRMAAIHVVQNKSDTPYHVVGFSRGAAPDVMGGFMNIVRLRKDTRLPEDIMTVGLYGPKGQGFTPRYVDNHYECINFLDSSGQKHVGEHNAVNLGADVSHLPEGDKKGNNRGGMAIVADMFLDGKNPLKPVEVLKIPEVGGVLGPLIGDKTPAVEASTVVIPASVSVVLVKQQWPTQSRARAFYGNPEAAGWRAANLVDVLCPWELDFYGKKQNSIQIHKKCAESLGRILEYVWEQCGKDQEKINSLHYNKFSGSYNFRPVRGGKVLSNHALGAALDLDDQENQFHSTHHLFTDESLIVKAFKAENWSWGGDWSVHSIDAMHFEAISR